MMRNENFYLIVTYTKIVAGPYDEREINIAKRKLDKLTEENPGTKFHIVKRMHSALIEKRG